MSKSVCSLLAMFILGCSGSSVDRLETVPASGTVTLDGKSFGPATLDFLPTSGDKVHNASGAVKEDGTFVATTYESGDGIVPGTYTVKVSVPIESASPAPNVKNFEFTVDAGGSNSISIALESKKGNVGTLLSPEMGPSGASTDL
ncbi:MAG: hypothetical protein R3C49_03775 [Planctomycetaceae bacterium]